HEGLLHGGRRRRGRRARRHPARSHARRERHPAPDERDDVKSLPARLAITILVPGPIYFLSYLALVPGADPLAGRIPDPSQAAALWRSRSVFALGVMPAMSAFGIIELVAFLVPRLRRLRHGNPEGRAKLDRAARALTMVLAGFQAFGISMSLKSLAAS